MAGPSSIEQQRVSSGDIAPVLTELKQASTTIVARNDKSIHHDPDARAAFLSSFSAKEEKTVLRKVDKQFLLLIGFMYMIKQVRTALRGLRTCKLTPS